MAPVPQDATDVVSVNPHEPAGSTPPRPRAENGGQRRKEWGRDRRTRAMPMVPEPVSDQRLALGRLAIMVTVTAWVGYVVTWFFQDFFNPHYETVVSRAEAVLYLLIVTMLTVSALAYLLARLGFFYRTRKHHRASRAILDQFFDTATPTLTTIIPSYQEDERVIRTTVLSAALQEYPDKRVVLLIDDPYQPKTKLAREQLLAARALPGKIEQLMAEPAAWFARALESFELSCQGDRQPDLAAMIALAEQYDGAVRWLSDLAAEQEIIDHTDTFFANEVVLRLAGSLQEIATALRDSAAENVVLASSHLRRLYRRLVWIFRVEVTSFERKQYVSLSHEPNKAMNLNSYMGLMGGTYREVRTVTGLALVRSSPAGSDLIVPNPDYVVTLDADSVLLPEYCLRLVHLLEQSEYRDVSITQTPYSAFPGSGTRLERIAGATTDLQHIVHQGLTYYDATFWVGANAVIRKGALDQIAETSYLGDWEIKHYIRDRTVIEDTESTIDMGIHGWKLHNYPERLSYSATPPDFGSLSIQRSRWANGGLLILPKLWRQSRTRKSRGERTRFGELFLRWNYMASISWSSASLLVLLAFPFNATLISPLLGLVAFPYFVAMASDLRYCGYKRLDVFRIYGFNLVLLPVNLAGTVSSIAQGITASKAAFARTPKVNDRTVVPPSFVISPYLLIGLAGYTFYRAYQHHLVVNMVYAALNVTLAIYATMAFIGLRNSLVDGWIHATSLLYKPAKRRKRFRRKPKETSQAPADWRSVLEVNANPAAVTRTSASVPPRAPVVPSETERLDGPPKRKLSMLRILVALALVGAAGYAGFVGVRTKLLVTAVPIRQTWFAPYVDVTLTPTYQFQNVSADPARQTVLGFVVSNPGSPCVPNWGSASTLRQADQAISVGARIAQMQQNGAQPIVSFGGQANTSLDVGCTSVPSLTQTYQSVIDRYHLSMIDLDVEGAALNDFNAGQRRAQAVAALQKAHPDLGVWLTLPVEPNGLQANAMSVIESMLRQRVSITGINVMTMDFAQPPANGSTMLDQAESALNATHAQLADLLPRYGVNLQSQQIWQRMGATVMIGTNDIKGERFTIGDAQGLASFSAANHLGRVSLWSLNRDRPCGSTFADTGLLSNTCSGTAQSEFGFSQVFGAIQGSPSGHGSAGDVQPPVADKNPAHAPYPLWSPTSAYPLGYKVVENGEIFQAKWYNTGQDPATQSQFEWQSPWELLGPVLPTDRAPVITKLRPGTYPAWSLHVQYKAHMRVLYHGLPYEAKWANQGVVPGGNVSGSSWKPLFSIPGEPAG
jgi:cellulose synthase/poly-beta-1,6-N-acetylglucosamine synthase-like glycosyltransferase/chitodextrinase